MAKIEISYDGGHTWLECGAIQIVRTLRVGAWEPLVGGGVLDEDSPEFQAMLERLLTRSEPPKSGNVSFATHLASDDEVSLFIEPAEDTILMVQLLNLDEWYVAPRHSMISVVSESEGVDILYIMSDSSPRVESILDRSVGVGGAPSTEMVH